MSDRTYSILLNGHPYRRGLTLAAATEKAAQLQRHGLVNLRCEQDGVEIDLLNALVIAQHERDR